MEHKDTRREFVKKVAVGGIAAFGIPRAVSAALDRPGSSSIKLDEGSVILFQGDSITDAGRNRKDLQPNSPNALGSGYAFIAASQLLRQHAGSDLKIYNRGVSGNKVFQLSDRWQNDCLDLKPDVLSILIGVNDFWHTLTNDYKGTVKTFNDDYDKLLQRTSEALPDAKIIIGEPFAIPGVKAVDNKWFPQFDEYRYVAKKLAKKYKATFIPYQSIIDKALKVAPGRYWTHDGVHPSLAGSGLMAEAWLDALR